MLWLLHRPVHSPAGALCICTNNLTAWLSVCGRAIRWTIVLGRVLVPTAPSSPLPSLAIQNRTDRHLRPICLPVIFVCEYHYSPWCAKAVDSGDCGKFEPFSSSLVKTNGRRVWGPSWVICINAWQGFSALHMLTPLEGQNLALSESPTPWGGWI